MPVPNMMQVSTFAPHILGFILPERGLRGSFSGLSSGDARL